MYVRFQHSVDFRSFEKISRGFIFVVNNDNSMSVVDLWPLNLCLMSTSRPDRFIPE